MESLQDSPDKRARQRGYERSWYARNKERAADNQRAYRERNRELIKQRNRDRHAANPEPARRAAERNKAKKQAVVDAAKSRPCMDCGGTFHLRAMEFDHRPGEGKTAGIATIVLSGGMQALLDEIAKCDVVCANCHRVRTFTRLEARRAARSVQ